MKTSFPAWLGLLLVGLWLGGCATFSRAPALGVSLVDLRPTAASVLETTAGLTVRMVNETPVPFALTGSTHRLYLNGTYVGRGVSNESAAIPALGSATQTVTLYLENLALLAKFRDLPSRPVVEYRLESRLFSNVGQDSRSVGATATGSLDLGNLGDFFRR